MQMKIDIKPHKGINEIQFGLNRSDVHKLLGPPESTKKEIVSIDSVNEITQIKTDYFVQSNLQISYDKNDTIEFIEIYTKDSNLEISIFGFSLNHVKVEDVINFFTIERSVNYDENGQEFPFTYNFLKLDLTFWRQVLPENEND